MSNVISIATRRNSLVARPVRAQMPADIKLSMDNWRLGGCWQDVPADYQAWHRQLASEELDRITQEFGLEVINDPRIVDEGWFDGMGVVTVEVLTRSQKRLVLEWCDANQGFMRRFSDHGGKGALFGNDLA